VDEELGVEPGLRAAAEAVLGELARAYVVDRAGVAELGAERGHLVVRERIDPAGRGVAPAADARRLDDALSAAGGGRLADAVRHDPGGAARALLAWAVWAPDLGTVLAIQPHLPPGWLAVSRDGRVVADGLTLRVGLGDTPLERRAEAERLARDVVALEAEAAQAERSLVAASADARAARDRLVETRAGESAASTARRRAEEAERAAGRELEAAAREAAWHRAQAERLASEAERARSVGRGAASDPADPASDPASGPAQGAGVAAIAASGTATTDAVAAWNGRVAELRARRDRLAADAAELERTRRDADARRARAEAAVALAEPRLAGIEQELGALAERERAATDERDTVNVELGAMSSVEADAREALEALLADDRAERARLAEAERAATAARERLRVADDRARSADVAAMEARLALDTLREQVLVELAGLGETGIRHLASATGLDVGTLSPAPAQQDKGRGPGGDGAAATGDGGPDADAATSAEGAALEAALDVLAPRWAAEPPATEAPSPGRLAVLRRRYHELGAANPFAVDEYRAVRERLETLDAQDRDLRDAIAQTRTLIADLDQLIATQFRATFAALEVAFDARFRQLFGGGFARLSLTDPVDLSATGVEITARPPGKKPQALSMLSGGERALTAVALLFAMLEVRPTPFCVLDEVDAALDEANVGRFTDALRELAERTQFVVITHNRGTIEIADALYGVTVGDDSVSRVISLRLDEARDRAAARGAELRAVPVGDRGA
jgi:chromosome segregation protein